MSSCIQINKDIPVSNCQQRVTEDPQGKASVSILTLQESDNYGAVVQAFALLRIIQSLGYAAKIIPFVPRYWHQERSILKLTKKRTIRSPRRFYAEIVNRLNHRRFRSFRNRFLYGANPKRITAQQVVASGVCSKILVVGSDQVWNLKFAPASLDERILGGELGGPEVWRVSYAASVGHDMADPAVAQRIVGMANRFNCVGVREPSLRALLESSACTCRWTLDPTLVADPAWYSEIIIRGKAPPPNGNYVFAYVLPHNNDRQCIQSMGEVAEDRAVQGILCHLKRKADDFRLPEIAPTPETWLRHLSQSGLVVTNSYHGVALSIAFKRDFIVMPTGGSESGMNERITSLLDRLGLLGRLIANPSMAKHVARVAIDWVEVDKRLSSWKSESLGFLEGSIADAACKRSAGV